MATTVTYKGRVLVTVDNQTKVLETSGTWMEDDLTLTDSSGSGTITVVDVPDAHGGIEKRITAVDISDTTATAEDVASGEVFYTANGTRTVGTASSGGEWTTDGIATNAEPSGALTFGNSVTVIQDDAFRRKQGITSVTGSAVTEIKNDAFNECRGITSASFPNLINIRGSAFENCRGLTSFNAPNVERAEGNALRYWTSFTGNMYLPKLTYFGNCYGSAFQQARFPILETLNGGDNFRNCTTLEVIDLGNTNSIAYESAFIGTSSLKVLILRKTSSITTLGRGNWSASGTPTLYDGTCKIYVPQALKSSYISASNWSSLPNASTQFVALEGSSYEQPDFVYNG